MSTIWHLFTGDIRRITSNLVTILIAIGLVAFPGLFAWFNIAASWDPFGNTKNLKFAVASTDAGYRSDLIPVKITVGDQVMSELRSNSQLDWTFTNEQEAIEGTKSGKYYAAVIIGKDFSKNMMTFFSDGTHHAMLTYYTNEKKNAVAPKVTGQGADAVAAEINQTFATTIASTALSIASQLSQQLDKPEARHQLSTFTANIDDFASQLTSTATTLRSYASLTESAQTLLTSSDALIANASKDSEKSSTAFDDANSGVSEVNEALTASADTLSKAFTSSAASYDAVASSIDKALTDSGATATDSSAALRKQADAVDEQISQYTAIRDDINTALGPGKLVDACNAIIDRLTTIRNALNDAASTIDTHNADAEKKHRDIKSLSQQASASISQLNTDFTTTLRPQIQKLSTSISDITTTLGSGSTRLKDAVNTLNDTTDTAKQDLATVRATLSSTADLLNGAAGKLSDFNGKLSDALNSGDMGTLRDLLGNDPDTLATALAAPVQIQRHAVFPVKNFGAALTPYYTLLPLWVGSLLMAVTLKTSVSRATRKELGNPRSHQLFFGRFGIFAVISLLQSTFSGGGTLLFLRVETVHPWLFMLATWTSGLVYAFIIYVLVVSFGNVGKAIGVIALIVQISGSGGAYPLQVLPDFISRLSPFLPIHHSVQALRAAIAGIYQNDYFIHLGWLLLFVPPMLLLGLALQQPLSRFNRWYMAQVERTKLL